MGTDALAVVFDLLTALLRGGVEGLGRVVADPTWGQLVRLVTIAAFPFAVARQLYLRAWPLALTLGLITVYLGYNRLGVFAGRPLTWGDLLGNVGLLALALLFLVPRRWWDQRGAGGAHD